MEDILYLIISHENFCVYTCTTQLISANALASSSIDCWVRAVTPFLNNFTKFKSQKEFYENIWKNDKRSGQLVLVDPSLVSELWLLNREIIKRRQELFAIWEIHTNNALLRVETTKWVAFSAVADIELKLCKPDQNIYSPMIEEYAHISGRPVEQVYDELNLKIETENITKFRITALAEKFKDMINQATTLEEFDKIKTQMFIEFWGNAET